MSVDIRASGNGLRWSWAAPLLLGVAYYAGARLGFAFTLEPRPVSVLWLPNALLFAALLLTAPRRWWVLLAAALAAHLVAQIRADVPLPMVVCWFISNSAEALIGAVLVRRYSTLPFRLDRFSHVVVFTAAALFAVFVSCFLDAAFVALNDWGSSGYWSVWRIRFFSNALAALTVVPAIVGLSGVRLRTLDAMPPARALEALLLVTLLLLANGYAFGRDYSASPDRTAALLYMPLPLLLWAAVRFGPGAAGGAVLITVLIATSNAVSGRGPFTSSAAESRALEIQLLFGTVAIAQVALAAVMAERQRAQAEVWRNREQLRLAVEAAQMTSWDWVVRDNRRATRPELYRELEAILGRIHPSDKRTVSRAFRRALRDGKPVDLQFRVARPDGDVRWVHGLGRVLRDEQRGQVRVVGLSADITERKLSEALNRGESRILEMIATGASLRNILEGIVRLIESESLGLLGSVLLLERDGVHVRHYASPSLPESYTREIDGMKIGPNAGSCGAAMYLRQPVFSERIREDARWEHYRDLALRHGLQSCWSVPMFSDRGAVLGSFAIYYRYPRRPSPREHQLVEIGTQLAVIAVERRRAEFDASEQRRALAHLGRVAALGELSGTLAHELSQPLSVILSQAQAAARLLHTADPPVPELRSILAEIVSAERRAARVIQHTRTMLTQRSPDLKPQDVNQIVIGTLDLMRGDLAARDVVVRTRLAAGLPPVQGDHVQLQQVLLNILFNACDAMSASAPADRVVTIVTRRTPEANFVELGVTDYGTGIPEDQIRNIFDQFYTSKDHGLGLGLSICRSIVLAHGGRISAANNPDAGATLLLQLPTSMRSEGSARGATQLRVLASHADAR